MKPHHLDVQHTPIVQTALRRHGEMAYTADSKSAVREDVWVQVPLPAVETRQLRLRLFDGFLFWQWGAGDWAPADPTAGSRNPSTKAPPF